MAARAWHTAEVLSQQATNSEYPTFVSACDLTFTPDANSTYVLFATGCHGYSNSVGSSSVKVAFYSASLDPKVWFTDQLSFLPRVVQPWQGKSFLCAGVISFGAAPPEFTCTVGFSAEETTYTAYIKDVRITAFKLEQDDKGIFNSGSISTTSTSWQDAASLTFTPPSAGDYLIITRATLRTNYAGASAIISAVLDVDGTESGQGQLCARSILTQSSWGTIQKVTLPASSKTIKIKYRTNDALREVHIADRVLIALRLSDFGGALYVEDNTVASTNTLQTYITLNESFDSGDWLLMGVAQTAGDNIGREYEDVLRLGSKNLQSAIIRPESVYAWGEIETYACFSVQQAYDGSAKPNLAYRRSSLICTVYVTNGRIAALNLGASPPPPPVSFIPNVMIHKSIPSFLGGLN